MKVEAIVYESNTGFTKKYAELLAQNTGLKAYERKTAGSYVKKGAAIFYMGWLLAGSVKGFKKAGRKYSVKAVGAVGMGSPTEESASDIVRKYQLTDIPVFYLQGGFDKNKLRGIYKVMMKNVAKMTEDAMNKKEQKTDEDLLMLDIVKNGGDFVKKENLDTIISWIM